ncbi:MAG: TldD/PmbA family protein [Candidatus Thorarchaeota archaeon]
MSVDILSLLKPMMEKALKLGASEVELYAQRTDSKDVNVESSSLKSAISQSLEGVGIRVLKDKSVGFASVNSLIPDTILDGIKSAVAIASVTPASENYYLSAPKKIRYVKDCYDPAVAEMSMDDVIGKAEAMLRAALDVDERIKVDTGTFSAATYESAIVTSAGIETAEKKSILGWIILGMAVEGDDIGSFDYNYNASVSLKNADVETTATELATRVLKYLKAEKTDSFEGQAIISPDALIELSDVFIQSASASKIQAGSSYLQDRLGERVFSEEFTLIDDGAIPEKTGSSSFDREGVPHSKHPIFEKGVFKGILYDTFTANKEGLDSTGHASGVFRQAPRITATNLEMRAGSKSVEDMISEVDHGLYIPRISAFPDPVSGDFAGPVKGGQLIKRGEIIGPVKEITISGNLFEALKGITAVSKERKFAGFQGQSVFLPHIALSGLKFAS